MKKLLLPTIAALAFWLSACTPKADLIEPRDDGFSGGQEKTVGVVPTITSISGNIGFSTSNASNSFSTYLQAELNGGSTLTLSGSNLGSSQGSSTIVFEKQNANGTWSLTSSYTLTVVSWTSTQIKVKLQSSTASIPIATARFKVTTSSGIATKTLSVVPYIWTRQYEQCTWWCTKRTLEVGGSGWSPAYSGGTIINANYVPTSNDILMWTSNPHMAFIENVAVTNESATVKKYVLSITEANVPWSGNNYTTAPQTYSCTVKIQTNSNGTKSFVAGYDKYRSTLTSGANQVRIQ